MSSSAFFKKNDWNNGWKMTQTINVRQQWMYDRMVGRHFKSHHSEWQGTAKQMNLSTNEDKQAGDCCQKCRIQRVIDNVNQMKEIMNGNILQSSSFLNIYAEAQDQRVQDKDRL